MALTLIGAAALATFLALYLTSRPYDPMDSSVDAQQTVPAGPSLASSPKPSPTATATPNQPSQPSGETAVVPDSTIQADIEKSLSADNALSGLDVSTIVEGGKVTIVGSVKSPELKQRVERVIHAVKGVASVDNQLVVLQETP